MAPLKGQLAEMEAEVNILGSKIGELGNVNLKAPEIYDERKRTVEEASSRVFDASDREGCSAAG